MTGAEQRWPDDGLDWRTMVTDVEKQVETLTNALEELRFAVRRLSLAKPLLEDGALPPAPSHATASVPEDDPVREEVRRAVQETRAELTNGEALFDGPPEPEPLRHDSRRHLETTKWDVSDGSSWPSAAPSESSRERGRVHRAVETSRADLSNGSKEEEQAPELEAPRSRAAMMSEKRWDVGDGSSWPSAARMETDPARDEVRRTVETTRAELHNGSETRPAPVEAADEEEAREEVRRAVEQARAELTPDTPPVAPPPPKTPLWSSSPADLPGMPPSMVIEDQEGRIELARVYETLNRLDCAGQATLLNYAPHSVTVGLGAQNAPSPEAISTAITAVFGRSCHVAQDGSRISVRIGGRPTRAA